MEKKEDKQINRVITIMEMVQEDLNKYWDDSTIIEAWLKNNPDKYRWQGPYRKIKKAEIKRLLLMLRQETIKLDKML